MQSVLGADCAVTAVVGEERATYKSKENGLVIDDKCTDDSAFVLLTDMLLHRDDTASTQFHSLKSQLRDCRLKT